jgi:hypothetical protein
MQSTQDGLKEEEQARTKPTDPEQQVRRSTRQRRIPDRYSDFVVKAKGCYTDISDCTPLFQPLLGLITIIHLAPAQHQNLFL